MRTSVLIMTAAYLEKLLILTFRAAACPSVGNDDIMSDQKGGEFRRSESRNFLSYCNLLGKSHGAFLIRTTVLKDFREVARSSSDSCALAWMEEPPTSE